MDSTEKNIPFSKAEIRGWKEELAGKRGFIENTEPNRAARRLKEKEGEILNNRKQTEGRGKPHRVLMKMAHFSMRITDKKMRLNEL